MLPQQPTTIQGHFKPLMVAGNYSAISNDIKLVHWPLTGGQLHLVWRVGDQAGRSPAQTLPRCTKCNSPPINGQLLYNGQLLCSFNVPIIKGLNTNLCIKRQIFLPNLTSSKCWLYGHTSRLPTQLITQNTESRSIISDATSSLLLLLVCMSLTITGQPLNSVFICRVQPR